jgi:hypothetical protein
MTNAQPPDALKNLVLFIIGIAILGTIIALAMHYGVELPAQNNIKAPSNGCSPDGEKYYLETCPKNCDNNKACEVKCADDYVCACKNYCLRPLGT